MGIPRPVARLLFEEGRRRPFGGSVIQLGRCAVFLRWDELLKWARRDGFALREDVPIELSHLPQLARLGCLSDRTFFRALGFETVESLDLLGDERPTYIQDLNQPVPAELEGRFDVVFDTGTMVHVFDQKTAFRNLARMIKPGGRVIHGTAPSSNHVDIGFYMFSPTLFADFYTANRWQIDSLKLCEFVPLWYRGRFDPPVWKVRQYEPGSLDEFRLGGLDWRPRSVWAVATKIQGAGGDVSPIQGSYRAAHEASADRGGAIAFPPPDDTGPAADAPAPPLPAKATDWALRTLKRVRRLLRRPFRRLPPVVARL